MSKHTPGPWEIAYQDKNGQLVVAGKHIEIVTCWHHCVGSIEKEMHANARLIAKSPEMYDLLKVIADDLRHDNGLIPIDIKARARAIIDEIEMAQAEEGNNAAS